MTRAWVSICRIGAGLALASAVPAGALCRLCTQVPEGGSATLSAMPGGEQGPRVEILADLGFARLALRPGSSGSVRVDPGSGQASAQGGAVMLGGFEMSGRARVTGTPGRLVRIDLPREVRARGGTTGGARIVDLRTDLPRSARLGADGALEFGFGGTLLLDAGAAPGAYRARVPIAASYE